MGVCAFGTRQQAIRKLHRFGGKSLEVAKNGVENQLLHI